MIEAHAKLIDALGGGSAIAEALWGEAGKQRSAQQVVYKWKRNGIPWRWRTLVEKLAHERGVKLPSGFLLPAHGGRRPERQANGRSAA